MVETLVGYGPVGVAAAFVLVLIRLFIIKGYGIKVDIGPRR